MIGEFFPGERFFLGVLEPALHGGTLVESAAGFFDDTFVELAEEDAYAVDGPAQAPALLELRDAMSLVWRILLLWLAVLSLFVLAGFVN